MNESNFDIRKPREPLGERLSKIIHYFNSDYQEPRETKVWQEYTVGVMGASSNENKEAVTNGREIGKILAEMGYSVANGGYAVGGMGATADGFRKVCEQEGLTPEEIRKHFSAVVLSEKAIGSKLAGQRKYIEPAKKQEHDDFIARSGGIIQKSDAVVCLPGGIGTIIEGQATMMDEWFKQRLAGEGKGRPKLRPTIIIDSKNTLAKVITMAEAESPGTTKTISDDIFILAGHKLPSGEVANLENDPQMRNELKMLLEYYQLIGLGKNAVENDPVKKHRVEEIIEYINKDMNRFVALKDVVDKNKELFKNITADWGTEKNN